MPSMEEIFLCDYKSIHQRYSELINLLPRLSPVLKTDLWNELKTGWPIHADCYAEIDGDMVQDGISKGLNAVQSNIEKLVFDNHSFSTIIDLSTIDHIKNPFVALKEYFRILKNEEKSVCYVVCWLGKTSPHIMEQWSGIQYYFDESTFISAIYRNGFRIETWEKFEGLGDSNDCLKFFSLKKANNFLPDLLIKLFGFNRMRSFFKQYTIPDGIVKSMPDYHLDSESFDKCSLINIDFDSSTSIEHDFKFFAKTDDPQIILQPVDIFGDYLLLQVEISPPEKTILQVFYLTNGIESYTEENSVKRVIGPDNSTVRMIIPFGNPEGRIRLDPGNVKGKYHLKRIAISNADAIMGKVSTNTG